MPFNPVSTYRIQFHKDFSLACLGKIIPYLKKLGVRTIYASPIFNAVPGSMHGYDVLNPLQLNPEIGTIDQLEGIHEILEKEKMSWIQDIVPNHMAYHPYNVWLSDVLEKGNLSLYYDYFDIQWDEPFMAGKLMAPFLNKTLKEAIAKKELVICYEEKRLYLKFFGLLFPLSTRSYYEIIDQISSRSQVNRILKDLKGIIDPARFKIEWDNFLDHFSNWINQGEFKGRLNSWIAEINNSETELQRMSDLQFFQLCHWQESDVHINYRRFFIINSLICLNMQEANVFSTYHEFVHELINRGIFQGLRIDHVDGLYDPTNYISSLRNLVGSDTYITVEKILHQGEHLPAMWQVEGTTGYDFLSLVNNLFTNRLSEEQFTDFYEEYIRNYKPLEEKMLNAKTLILEQHMRSEWDQLYHLLMKAADSKWLSSIYPSEMKTALAEFLIHFPVYRFYGNKFPLDTEESRDLEQILQDIQHYGKAKPAAIDVLRRVLIGLQTTEKSGSRKHALHFYMRCMQFTGPLIAKSLEDTLMYSYNRFIGHNEVGDSPFYFGIGIEEFHQFMIDRINHWPLTQNTSSTHDTKKGEDVRPRMNVLADVATEWFAIVREFCQVNGSLKVNGIPDLNDEYFIYQTLLGSFPMPGQSDEDYNERLSRYLIKALREEKTHSDWTDPNEGYEQGTLDFAFQLLNQESLFWNKFSIFHKKIADLGIVNSLTQVLLKFTCPGTPDIYQGCELWDLNFVDPDNRRPVDYDKRFRLLEDVINMGANNGDLDKLWENRYSGDIKIWLTHLLLQCRNLHPELFEKGEYIPIEVKGKFHDMILAFARHYKRKWIVVAVPLGIGKLATNSDADFHEIDWKDTRLNLPKKLCGESINLVTGRKITYKDGIFLRENFEKIPFLFHYFEREEKVREAGILLHVSSLPSSYGIGDLGPGAYSFADALQESGQKIWQMLPLNPVDEGLGYSPYSSVCSRAGNTWFISPEWLARDGLLEHEHLDQFRLPSMKRIDFGAVSKRSSELSDFVWDRVKKNKRSSLFRCYKDFANKESSWLQDFALFSVIKDRQNGKPWFQWPDELKHRDTQAISDAIDKENDAVEKSKFLQFLFFNQWKQLKSYCNNKSILLMGDLPIYVSYDSVDVWTNPDLFKLDNESKILFAAGTPPDAFSENGQLWGMPVYKWDAIRGKGFAWWIERFRKNHELFDIIRLDHFRGYSAYWEVPANEKTSRQGSWAKGPGADLFVAAREQLGELPFVAEDLGEIDQDVYALRDEFNFPGMKVLQFGFDEDNPGSEYLPHNYQQPFVVYTGTHDNDTTRGWFRRHQCPSFKKRLEEYFGCCLNEESISSQLIRMAYASVANMAIIPMQDILNEDESGRMNTPSSSTDNWGWRFLSEEFTPEIRHKLKYWTHLYNR